MIKAVIFDIDGVLIESFEANLKFYQNLMSLAGFEGRPTRKEFKNLFHVSLWDVVKEVTGITSEEELRKIWEMGRTKAYYPLELLKMPDGAEEAIQILYKDYQLALVSSRVKKGIEDFFEFSRMEEYFEIAIAYEDTDNHKPHPDPLFLAITKLGLTTKEAVYVGDASTDVEAANRAGMKIISYGEKKLKGSDVHTDTFRSIPSLVSRF